MFVSSADFGMARIEISNYVSYVLSAGLKTGLLDRPFANDRSYSNGQSKRPVFSNENKRKLNRNVSTKCFNELKKEFQELLTQKLVENSKQAENVKQKLQEFVEKNANVGEAYVTSELTIREVLKSIPNGKSSCFANISGEILKITPYLFNIGIIKPIVKNFKSDPNDIVNL
ncbi:hypothetical protein BpHYR1_042226 [Brachionus plicatilis]|uniref:Uncharacterized protein n=1 Tax=Brachionus plicatilis TaxID=10195 RepID=A0A3M7SGZ2_BRAPC|nr:hypothetical protein BpHYR1_042226 [Brachionus plicatilis]